MSQDVIGPLQPSAARLRNGHARADARNTVRYCYDGFRLRSGRCRIYCVYINIHRGSLLPYPPGGPLSNRVRAVATAVGLILRTPQGRAELGLLHAMLAYWQARTLARLVTASRREESKDRMLTVEQAAEVCGRSRSFLYERAEALGFGHRANGCRGLRISERELRTWMSGQDRP